METWLFVMAVRCTRKKADILEKLLTPLEDEKIVNVVIRRGKDVSRMKLTSFDQCWDVLRSNLRPTAKMNSWSVAGRAKGNFGIAEVAPGGVTVQTSKGPRLVPRVSFEVIFPLWEGYKSGNVPRYELRDISYNSTYVISILHWLEIQ